MMMTPAPGDGGPEALVQIIPGNLRSDFKNRDRAGSLNPARHEPANDEGIDSSERPPTDRFQNRSRVRLCT